MLDQLSTTRQSQSKDPESTLAQSLSFFFPRAASQTEVLTDTWRLIWWRQTLIGATSQATSSACRHVIVDRRSGPLAPTTAALRSGQLAAAS